MDQVNEGESHFEIKEFENQAIVQYDCFPSTATLAYFAASVYNQDFKSRDVFNLQTDNPKIQIEHILSNWKVLATSRNNGNGYYGAAYYNTDLRYTVIAHRGTDWKNFGSLWADYQGVFSSEYTPQIKSAYEFTTLILRETIQASVSLSVTGHSLGAWLAQTSTFFVKYPNFAEKFPPDSKLKHNLQVDRNFRAAYSVKIDTQEYHLHCVAFESPGSLRLMENYLDMNVERYPNDRFARTNYINNLDISVYFSSPNAINTCNMHVGFLYIIPSLTERKGQPLGLMNIVEFVKYTLDSHGMIKMLKFLQTPSNHEQLLQVFDWPSGTSEANVFHQSGQSVKPRFRTETVKHNYFRMSVFNETEKELLKTIFALRKVMMKENLSWRQLVEQHEFPDLGEGMLTVLSKFENADNDWQGFEAEPKDASKIIANIKCFVRFNSDLENVIKNVVSAIPSIYQAICQGFSREYISGLPKLSTIPTVFVHLHDFLDSKDCQFFQIESPHGTFSCMANVYKLCGSRNPTRSIFLNTTLLTTLERHVKFSTLVSNNSVLELVVVENLPVLENMVLETLLTELQEHGNSRLKIILVTSKPFPNIDLYSENYKSELVNESMLKLEFDALDFEEQERILDTEILFQGESIPISQLVSLEDVKQNNLIDSDSIIRLKSSNIKLALGNDVPKLSPFDASYYIPRIFYLNTVDLEQLKELGPACLIALSSNLGKPEVSQFFKVSKESIFEWAVDDETDFNKKCHRILLIEESRMLSFKATEIIFKRLDSEGCWVKLDGDSEQIIWLGSFGKNFRSRIQSKYSTSCDELGFLKQNKLSSVVLICDEPGMGKSTIMKTFAGKCKDTNEASPVPWVIFLSLESYKEQFRKLPLESINLKATLSFIAELEACDFSNETCYNLLTHLLKEECRVFIFLDGFDEICLGDQKRVASMAKCLVDSTRANVWIASRLHTKSSLENCFNTLINTFHPLEEPERVQFLFKFWTNHPDFGEKADLDAEKVDVYAKHLLFRLKETFDTREADRFIGIPLQLFMLALISMPYFAQFYAEGSLEFIDDHMLSFDNIFNLYGTFVHEKYRISIEDKCKLSKLTTNYPWHDMVIRKSLSTVHQLVSFHFLFPQYLEMVGVQDEYTEQMSSEEVVNEILRVGIVQTFDKEDPNSIQFIHRSVAEYFAAEFLVSKLRVRSKLDEQSQNNLLEFLKRNYFVSSFDKIRYFIDHFIAEEQSTDDIYKLILNWNKQIENIYNRLETGKLVNTDLLGRTVLHYAVLYGNHKDGVGILWMIIQNYHLIQHKDIFGATFFGYVVLLPKFGLDFFPHPHLTISDFLKCFHNCVYAKVQHVLTTDREKDLDWICWFAGGRIANCNKEKDHNRWKSTFAKEMKKDVQLLSGDSQNHKFATVILDRFQPAVDFSVAAMRGDTEIGAESVFFLMSYLASGMKSPDQFIVPFTLAMKLGGELQIRVAQGLFDAARDRSPQTLPVLAKAILENDLFIYKKSLHFLNDSFEQGIWNSAGKSGKVGMCHVMISTEMVSFRRAVQAKNLRFVSGILQVYQKTNVEHEFKTNCSRQMLDILRVNDDEILMKLLDCCEPESLIIWRFICGLNRQDEIFSNCFAVFKVRFFDALNQDVILDSIESINKYKLVKVVFNSVAEGNKLLIKQNLKIRIRSNWLMSSLFR